MRNFFDLCASMQILIAQHEMAKAAHEARLRRLEAGRREHEARRMERWKKFGEESLQRLAGNLATPVNDGTKWGEAEDAELIEAEPLVLGKPDGC